MPEGVWLRIRNGVQPACACTTGESLIWRLHYQKFISDRRLPVGCSEYRAHTGEGVIVSRAGGSQNGDCISVEKRSVKATKAVEQHRLSRRNLGRKDSVGHVKHGKKRRMSASARARIAKAQRARWARFRAAKAKAKGKSYIEQAFPKANRTKSRKLRSASGNNK